MSNSVLPMDFHLFHSLKPSFVSMQLIKLIGKFLSKLSEYIYTEFFIKTLYSRGNCHISALNVLYHTLRGIRRSQGNALTRPKRSPITISNLHSIAIYLNRSGFTAHDKSMFLASALTAFFDLLRISEYTCPLPTFDASWHISTSDVQFNKEFSMMNIRLKASKTDPFRIGVTIRIAALNQHPLCPVAAMREYLKFVSHNNSTPLFVKHNGHYLTRQAIVALLKIVFCSNMTINTHSFRIGGATAALAAGASDSLIRSLGRWTSACYLRYLRISDNELSLIHI